MSEVETIENVVYGIRLDGWPDPGMPQFLKDLRAYLSEAEAAEKCSWYLLLEESDRMADWLKRLSGILGFTIPKGAEIIWTGPESYRIGICDTPPDQMVLGFHTVYVCPRDWEADWHCSQWSDAFVRRASIYTWTESAE